MSAPTRFSSVIVLAKRPMPGRVKTRLTPPLTPHEAADVAAGALRDTLAAVGRVDADEHVLAFTDDALDWLPAGWRSTRQPEGGLDVRIAAAFASAGPGPSLLVGMDTPQLAPHHLVPFDPARFDACLGPATDGGFWALGLADPRDAARVVPGVVMSTARTGADQRARLLDAGLRVQDLAVLTDVDTIDTAVAVAAQVPGSHFARALAGTTVRT